MSLTHGPLASATAWPAPNGGQACVALERPSVILNGRWYKGNRFSDRIFETFNVPGLRIFVLFPLVVRKAAIKPFG